MSRVHPGDSNNTNHHPTTTTNKQKPTFTEWNTNTTYKWVGLLCLLSRYDKHNELYHSVTPFLTFKDVTKKEMYEQFRRPDNSYTVLVVSTVLIICFFVSTKLSIILNNETVLSFVSFGLCLISPIVTGLWLVYFQMKRTFNELSRNIRRVWVPRIESYWVVGVCLAYSLSMVSVAQNGTCGAHRNFSNYWGCSHDSSQRVPLEMISTTMFVPVMLSLVLKGVRWRSLVLSWVMNLGFVCFCLANYGASHIAIGALCIYAPISIMLLYDHRRQNIIGFLHSEEQDKLLLENQRQADALQLREMRHMVGNVAHDLKTPLSSFVTGLELMASLATEMECAMTENYIANRSTVRENVQSIQTHIASLRSANSFMTMTINRNLDFIKSSAGLSLTPTLTVTDLSETVDAPLCWVQDLAIGRTPITLKTHSSDIHRYITTDKQWLQENLLCLLSNAVKYSPVTSESNVTLSVFLADGLVSMTPAGVLSSVDISERSGRSNHRSSSRASNRSVSTSYFGSRRKQQPYALKNSIGDIARILEEADLQSSSSGSGHSMTGGVANEIPVTTQDEIYPTVDFPSTESGTAPGGTNSSLRVPSEQRFIRFEVEDCGPGIAAEAVDALFSPFKQSVRSTGGTGLGLYSLAKRMDALGGRYGVRSRQDGARGSVFWFAIPYLPEEPNAMIRASFDTAGGESFRFVPPMVTRATRGVSNVSTVTAPLHDSVVPVARMEPLNILLVDDSISIQKMTSMMLRKQGHSVVVVENGQLALDAIQKQLRKKNTLFDVVLMDLQMPVMDGLEATRQQRDREVVLNQRGNHFRSSHDSSEADENYHAVSRSLSSDSEDVSSAYCSSDRRRSYADSSDSYAHRIRSTSDSSDVMDFSHGDVMVESLGAVATKRQTVSSRSHDASSAKTVSDTAEAPLIVDPESARDSKSKAFHQLIIGVSANSDGETMQAAFAAGIDAFIPKPFTMQSFHETFNQWRAL